VVVGPAGNDAITVLGDSCGQGLGIDHDLPLIFAKLRLKRLVKTNRFGGDDVHERAALHSGKKRRIDLLAEFLLAQHDAAARPAQTFMRCGRDKLRMRYRTRVLAAGD
jgi:hypothetical protein